MNMRAIASRVIAAVLFLAGSPARSAAPAVDQWQVNYDARQQYFEKTVGPLPADILKMLSMAVVWPGGGLFVIPAPQLGTGLAVFTTFGLSNQDMPTTVQATSVEVTSDGKRSTGARATLSTRTPAPGRAGYAGYGYEILMVAPMHEKWPLNFLQWAVNAEIGHDADLLDRVEKNGGLTVEKIDVGNDRTVNVLIARATAPLPTGTLLPQGKMDILVATTITEEAMRWAQRHGRQGLLKRLQENGAGQMSVLNRSSVVQ